MRANPQMPLVTCFSHAVSDPGRMFVGAMCKTQKKKFPSSSNPQEKVEVNIKEYYFDEQSSARTEMDVSAQKRIPVTVACDKGKSTES